jgi:hypothetical protein
MSATVSNVFETFLRVCDEEDTDVETILRKLVVHLKKIDDHDQAPLVGADARTTDSILAVDESGKTRYVSQATLYPSLKEIMRR